jgi:hypothetical protein
MALWTSRAARPEALWSKSLRCVWSGRRVGAEALLHSGQSSRLDDESYRQDFHPHEQRRMVGRLVPHSIRPTLSTHERCPDLGGGAGPSWTSYFEDGSPDAL